MCYVNTACDSCETVGLCIIIDNENGSKSVLCADCNKNREELETEFGQDDCIHIDEIDDGGAYDIDPAEYEASDEADMYGCDWDNDIAMGRYDE